MKKNKRNNEEKEECRFCAVGSQFHGDGGCFRALVSGKPKNCERFTYLKKEHR